MSRFLVVLALLGALALPSAAARPTVGVILEVKGPASVFLHEGSKAIPARVGQRLEEAVELDVPAGSSVLVGLYADGSEVRLQGPVVARMVTSGPVKASGSGALLAQVAPSVPLPGAAPEPVPGGVVLRWAGQGVRAGLVRRLWTNRPSFEWQSIEGAKYHFRLLDASGGQLVDSTMPHPAMPPLRSPLAWGASYVWELEARDADGRLVGSSRQLLVVAPREEAERVAEAVQALRTSPTEIRESVGARLRLAEFLLAQGYLVEASSLYEELLLEEPGNEVLRQLVADLSGPLGLPQRAGR